MKTLKSIKFGKVEIRVEQLSSNDNRVLGYMVSRFEDGLRYYLSSVRNLKETQEHLDFYINQYKSGSRL